MVTHDNDLARRAHRTIRLADGLVVDEWLNSASIRELQEGYAWPVLPRAAGATVMINGQMLINNYA